MEEGLEPQETPSAAVTTTTATTTSSLSDKKKQQRQPKRTTIVSPSIHKYEDENDDSNNNDNDNDNGDFNDGDKNASDCDSESVSRTTSSHRSGGHVNVTTVIVLLIIILGLATSGAFLSLGITSAMAEQDDQFFRSATDLVRKIKSAWEDYVHAASVIHGHCRNRDFTRQDFRNLYEYIIADGLDFQAAQFDPNVTLAERAAFEEEARTYYAEHYPHVNYTGFRGFNTEADTSLQPRWWNASFYFPIHYMEPVVGNEVRMLYIL